ncbi:hypothetical protein N2W54_003166 [Lotmaria passim]
MENAKCPNGAVPSESSMPFILFEAFCTCTLIVSSVLVYRYRRQAETRAQQRYDRLSRFELGTGVYSAT